MSTNYDKIKELYYNPSLGLQSKSKLYYKLKSEGIKLKEIDDFLKDQEVYQIHKKVKRIQNYFPHFASHPFHKIQCDLLDVSNMSSVNNGYKYILLCIDVMSRKVFYRGLKNKTNETVTYAMNEIINDNSESCSGADIKKPITILQCDKGSEFISASFKKLIQKYNIKIEYAEIGDHRALAVVNRFCRTIRELMEKYLTSHKTTRYIDVFDDLINNYNNSYHRTIKMTPNEAITDEETIKAMVSEKQRLAHKEEHIFEIGDKVRYLINKIAFSKGSDPKWSKTIHTVINKNIHSYILDNDKLYKYYDLLPISKVEELSKNINYPDATKEQLRKENKVKRLFKREDINVGIIPRISKRKSAYPIRYKGIL